MNKVVDINWDSINSKINSSVGIVTGSGNITEISEKLTKLFNSEYTKAYSHCTALGNYGVLALEALPLKLTSCTAPASNGLGISFTMELSFDGDKTRTSFVKGQKLNNVVALLNVGYPQSEKIAARRIGGTWHGNKVAAPISRTGGSFIQTAAENFKLEAEKLGYSVTVDISSEYEAANDSD